MGRRTLDNIDQKILRMTVKIGAKKGVERISTLDLAKKLDISEGTIFVHYKTKPNLLNQAFLFVMKRTHPLFERVRDCEPTRTDFFEVWSDLLKIMIDNPDYTRYFYSYTQYFGFEQFHKEIGHDKEYIEAVKKVADNKNGMINDDRALRIWNFTFNSSVRYAINILNRGQSYDEEDARFAFELIYGVLFNHPDFNF